MEWSAVPSVRSVRRTRNPRFLSSSKAWGEVTSWIRCRSIKRIAGASVSGTTMCDSQILSYIVLSCIGGFDIPANGVTDFPGLHQFKIRGIRINVACPVSFVENLRDGVVDSSSGFRKTERVFEHHAHGRDGSDGIRLTGSGNIRRGT